MHKIKNMSVAPTVSGKFSVSIYDAKNARCFISPIEFHVGRHVTYATLTLH
jgi:hypothetical protein